MIKINRTPVTPYNTPKYTPPTPNNTPVDDEYEILTKMPSLMLPKACEPGSLTKQAAALYLKPTKNGYSLKEFQKKVPVRKQPADETILKLLTDISGGLKNEQRR